MILTMDPDSFRRSPWRLLLWGMPTALLVAPAVAMQFTSEVQWTPFDFFFASVLLYGSAATADLTMRKSGSAAYRLGVGLAVLASFLLIWVNGAVGVIGNEDNPANLVFIVIIMIAAAGAVAAKFEARGMARAMTIAFVLNAAIAVGVPIYGWGADEHPGMPGLVALIGVFAMMWGLSAALFAKAARDQALTPYG